MTGEFIVSIDIVLYINQEYIIWTSLCLAPSHISIIHLHMYQIYKIHVPALHIDIEMTFSISCVIYHTYNFEIWLEVLYTEQLVYGHLV